MRSVETVMTSLIKLHEWRQAFNGHQLGFGFDPYEPDEPHYYAEACALWGRGYAVLSQLTGTRQFLDFAEQCADWLIKHPNPGYEGLSWGLPWEWATWNAPSTLSYLITTVFAGELFLSLYDVTRTESYLAVAENVAAWIENENAGVKTERGFWLYYANFPPLRFPVVNPTAKASGYFAWLYSITGKEHYRQLCLDTVRYVFSEQNTDGSWYYSTQSGVIDNVHTGFILEGLWSGYRLFSLEHWQRCLWKGTEFYWRCLFTSEGSGRERKRYGWKELTRVSLAKWMKDQMMMFGLLHSHIPETRLWGYGSALRAFVGASQADVQWLDKALLIYDYVRRNLALDDGSYAYRRTDKNAYIRHQAHLFAGLALLAQRLQQEEHSWLP